MAYRKISCTFVLLFILFSKRLYGEDKIKIIPKIESSYKSEIIVNVSIINTSEEKLFFYPEGVYRYINIIDKKLIFIPNNDSKYGEGFISAHEPIWNDNICITINPEEKVDYKYTIDLKSYSKRDIKNIKEIVIYLCIIDKSIKEIKSFEEYVENMNLTMITEEKF